jgi:hypothetical protein
MHTHRLAFLWIGITLLIAGCGSSNSSPATPTVAITPNPAGVPSGSTAGVQLTMTITGSGASAPGGAVTLTAATGSFSAPSCPATTGSDVTTCTSTYTPSGTLAVGTYSAYITASIAAAGSYAAATGTDSLTVTATPQPPVFTSTPPAAAQEGTAYTYNLTATDPSGGTVSFALTSGPGAIAGSTLTWTPTHAQSRTPDSFVVTATTSENAGSTQTWTVTPAGNIDGAYIITNVDASGNLYPAAQDLSQWTISALVPNGSGGYTTYAGTGTTGGTFTIPGVPAGSYWLEYGCTSASCATAYTPEYDEITTSNPALGYYAAGRPSAVYPPPESVSLAFDISGLDASWAQANYLFEVPNLPNDYILPLTYAPFACWTDALTAGTVNDTELWIDCNLGIPNALIDASQGDLGYFMAGVCSYPDSQSSLCPQTYSLAGISITTTAGGTTPVIGTASGTNASVEIAMARSQFAALRSGLYPSSDTYFLEDTFYAEPLVLGSQYGYLIQPQDLVLYGTSDTATTDFDLGSQAYSNPFSASLATVAYGASDQLDVHYENTAGNGFASANAVIYTSTTTAPTSASPLAPVVSPVNNPTIAGVSFFNNQSGVSATPTISWTAPTIGTVNAYQVYIGMLINPASTIQNIPVANFITTGTSVSIPPGLLSAGTEYIAQINAIYDAAGCAGSMDVQVCAYSLNEGMANNASGVITISTSASVPARSVRPGRPASGLALHIQEREAALQQGARHMEKSRK